MEKRQGLVIRFFCGSYALCDGRCPAGVTPQDDELYVGTIVRVYGTWREAHAMRCVIDQSYTTREEGER